MSLIHDPTTILRMKKNLGNKYSGRERRYHSRNVDLQSLVMEDLRHGLSLVHAKTLDSQSAPV